MASLNKVMLMGNLTRNPEIRYTPSGQAVCDLGLAMNRRYSVNGQDREDVCFVDIVVWAKQAESCSKYLHKGSLVFVDGRLHNDNWEDKDGKKRSRLRITAERVQFLNSKSDESRQSYKREDHGNHSQSNYHQPLPSDHHDDLNKSNNEEHYPQPNINQQEQTIKQNNTMPPPLEVLGSET